MTDEMPDTTVIRTLLDEKMLRSEDVAEPAVASVESWQSVGDPAANHHSSDQQESKPEPASLSAEIQQGGR